MLQLDWCVFGSYKKHNGLQPCFLPCFQLRLPCIPYCARQSVRQTTPPMATCNGSWTLVALPLVLHRLVSPYASPRHQSAWTELHRESLGPVAVSYNACVRRDRSTASIRAVRWTKYLWLPPGVPILWLQRVRGGRSSLVPRPSWWRATSSSAWAACAMAGHRQPETLGDVLVPVINHLQDIFSQVGPTGSGTCAAKLRCFVL